MRYRYSGQGFALIELMVVLSILAVLAGVAAPNFSSWLQDNRVSAIALQTRGALNAARSEAISRGETARIEFESGSIMTCIVSDETKTCDDRIENAPVQYISWNAELVTVGSNGAIENGILFNLRGRVTPHQNETLLTYCDNRGADNGILLTLNQIGQTVLANSLTTQQPMPVNNLTNVSMQSNREAGIGLLELLIAILLFSSVVISLTQLQFKSGMESLDNHQRSVALWSARALVDRISANSDQDALSEYQARISAITECEAYTVKQCEAVSTVSEVPMCSPTELAAYDVWSTFCEGEDSLSAQLIEFGAEISCNGGPCTTNSNMKLRLSWIARVSDSDNRLTATTPDTEKGDIPSNHDFVTLEFRP